MVQSQVTDNLRGRVMGVYTLIFFGSMPLGALFAGAVAERFGEPLTVMVCAVILLGLAVAALIFLPTVRRQE
jgi:MFS family permease